MRVISRKRLKEFWESPVGRGAEHSLRVWYKETKEAAWKGPRDIKLGHQTASILGGNRVVFNIGGNKFRLVVVAFYDVGIIFVRFVGTHAQYDGIDAEEV